jgi:hypothetical protein
MGNYSELYLTNLARKPLRGELESDSPYLLSKYHLPIAWLALFDQSDIQELPIDDSGEKWPYLIRSKESALTLLRLRQQWLSSHFPLLDPQWLSAFINYLDTAPFEYVHLDTSDIGSMGHGGSEWTKEMRTLLGSFADSSLPSTIESPADNNTNAELSSWKTYCAFFGNAYASPKCDLPYCYVGGSGRAVSAPWEEVQSSPGARFVAASEQVEHHRPRPFLPLLFVRARYKRLLLAIAALFKVSRQNSSSASTTSVPLRPHDLAAPIIVESREENTSTYYLGQQVTHPTFGPGIVVAMSGSGEDEIVSVNFISGEMKWLAVKYAKLQIKVPG